MLFIILSALIIATTATPTSPEPTPEPLPEEFGEVLIADKNYTLSEGSFIISNRSVIIRPNMIYSCSLKNMFVYLYEDQVTINNLTEKLQIGNPLFSLLIDINEMPTECPVLTGLILNVNHSVLLPNIIEIDLVRMDPTQIFLHCDLNLTNATVFELPLSEPYGDLTVDDMVGLLDDVYNETLDGNRTVLENATIIDDPTFFNFTSFSIDEDNISTRRRMAEWRASRSINTGITVTFQPWKPITISFGIHLHGNVSMLLVTSWLIPQRFRLEVELGFTAKVTAQFEVTAQFKALKDIIPARFKKFYWISILGIPVEIAVIHKLEIGVDFAASISGGCTFEFGRRTRAGFDCSKDRGCDIIKYTEDPSKNNGCEIIKFDKCEVSAYIWARPTIGLTVYRGLATFESPFRIGPKFYAIYPSKDKIKCPCFESFEFGFDILLLVEFKMKILDLPPKIQNTRLIRIIKSILDPNNKGKLSVTFGQIEEVFGGPSWCIPISMLLQNILNDACCKNITNSSSADPTTNPTRNPTEYSTIPTIEPTIEPTKGFMKEPTIEPTTQGVISSDISFTYSQWDSFMQNKDVFIIGIFIIIMLLMGNIIYLVCVKRNRNKHRYYAVDNSDNYEKDR